MPSQDQTRTSVAARHALMPSHVAATRSRKRSAAARNSEKNTTSGGPRFTVAVSPGRREGDRDLLEDPGPLLDDVLRRTGGDGPDVDPRDEHRDERDPPQLLEEREEPEAREREARQLGDVGGRVGSDQRESDGEDSGRDREPDERQRPQASERECEPDGGRKRREDDDGMERDVDSGRQTGEATGDRAVDREDDEERTERRRATPAQYGGCSAHQGPSALKAFQKAVFAGASSSASSISGVTSASIVGVYRWIAPAA